MTMAPTHQAATVTMRPVRSLLWLQQIQRVAAREQRHDDPTASVCVSDTVSPANVAPAATASTAAIATPLRNEGRGGSMAS